MEECINNINDDKNENFYKVKETEFVDENFPDEIGEVVNDRTKNN